MFYHYRNFLKHDCVDGLRAVPSPSGITVLAGHPIPAMADFPLVNDEDHSNVYPSCFYQLFHISRKWTLKSHGRLYLPAHRHQTGLSQRAKQASPFK